MTTVQKILALGLTMLLHASSCCNAPVAWAQVEVKDSYSVNEPILILVESPADPEAIQTLTVELDGPGAYRQIKLIDESNKPRVGILVANAPGEYTYRIDCTLTQAIDFNGKKLRVLLDGGFVRKGRFTVEGAPGPVPVPAPGPGPDDAALTPTAKASRDAIATLVRNMGLNFDLLAQDTKAGKYKTVTQAAEAGKVADQQSQALFKATMSGIMQPRLGSTDLPADAAQTFSEIASGFKAVK